MTTIRLARSRDRRSRHTLKSGDPKPGEGREQRAGLRRRRRLKTSLVWKGLGRLPRIGQRSAHPLLGSAGLPLQKPKSQSRARSLAFGLASFGRSRIRPQRQRSALHLLFYLYSIYYMTINKHVSISAFLKNLTTIS